MSNSGATYTNSTSYTSEKQPQQPARTMADNASVSTYASTTSLLKSKLKPSSWTPKKVQDQSLKTQGRKDDLKWPIFPGSPGPNSYL